MFFHDEEEKDLKRNIKVARFGKIESERNYLLQTDIKQNKRIGLHTGDALYIYKHD